MCSRPSPPESLTPDLLGQHSPTSLQVTRVDFLDGKRTDTSFAEIVQPPAATIHSWCRENPPDPRTVSVAYVLGQLVPRHHALDLRHVHERP